MDLFICNKCFIPIYRGHQPYNITQCGHIFCQNCMQQVEKQCPQCQYTSPVYLPLKDPLMPTTISFFEPVTEIWDMLAKADKLRTDQMKITMQRFHELDEKYEKLKSQFFQDQRNFKTLREKYMNLKNEIETTRKKVLQMRNICKMTNDKRSVSCRINTTDSNSTRMHLSSTGCSSVVLDSSKFSNVTPKYQIDADGFRVPNPRSGSSLFKKDVNLNYSFMK